MTERVKSEGGRGENEEKKTPNEEMTANLVDQELKLDDGRPALVLTVALHARTAEAESSAESRKKNWTGASEVVAEI